MSIYKKNFLIELLLIHLFFIQAHIEYRYILENNHYLYSIIDLEVRKKVFTKKKRKAFHCAKIKENQRLLETKSRTNKSFFRRGEKNNINVELNGNFRSKTRTIEYCFYTTNSITL